MVVVLDDVEVGDDVVVVVLDEVGVCVVGLFGGL